MISRHAAARPTHYRDRFTCLLMMVFPQVCSSSFAALLLFSAGDPVRAFNNNSFSRRGSLAERVTVNNNKVFRQHVAPFTTRSTSTSQKAFLNPEYGSILLSIVETFDGSTITDPVVISGVFWSSLKTKILSVIIGQFLASIVFGVLAYVLSSQFSKIGDYISNNVFKENSSTRTRTGNRDAVQNNVQEFAQNVKQKSQSPTLRPHNIQYYIIKRI